MSIINSQSKKQEKQEPPSCFYTLRLCNMRNSSLFSLRPIRYNSAAAPGVCGLLLVCLVRDCEKIQQPMRMHGRQRRARRTGGEGGFFFFLFSCFVFSFCQWKFSLAVGCSKLLCRGSSQLQSRSNSYDRKSQEQEQEEANTQPPTSAPDYYFEATSSRVLSICHFIFAFLLQDTE